MTTKTHYQIEGHAFHRTLIAICGFEGANEREAIKFMFIGAVYQCLQLQDASDVKGSRSIPS